VDSNPQYSKQERGQDVAKERYKRETQTKISTFLNMVSIILSNSFYDTQSKFQNEVILPKKTREVHFITSMNLLPGVLL
jgi:hypothetical protein